MMAAGVSGISAGSRVASLTSSATWRPPGQGGGVPVAQHRRGPLALPWHRRTDTLTALGRPHDHHAAILPPRATARIPQARAIRHGQQRATAANVKIALRQHRRGCAGPRPRISMIARVTVDVSGLGRDCTVVSRARTLAEWVGAGRPVTAKGVLRRADAADAARVIDVEMPPRVRTAADVPKLHHPWLVAQAAGWLRIDTNVAVVDAPTGSDSLEIWEAGLDAVLRDESHDRRQAGARVACRAVLTALATDPPTPRDQLEETVHALLEYSDLGDATAVYQAFRRGIMPVDAALEVLADFGAVDNAHRATLTPLGRWAWQRLGPAAAGVSDAEHLSASDLLTALASGDEYEAFTLAKRWLVARPLADGCHQLLQAAAATTPAERIAIIDLIASLGEATTSVWRDALTVPNLGAHAAAVLAQWDAGPELTGPQEAWLATEYALATLARDGIEDAHHDVRDLGGIAVLEAGGHPHLATLRQAIDEYTASGTRPRVLQLKIALDHMRPPVWRRVLVAASATLADLHDIIHVVLDWDDDHLHMFTTGSGRYSDPYYDLDDCDDEHSIRLSRAMPRSGATIGYVYDFGDNWKHTITLEKIDHPAVTLTHPICMAGRGDAPTEDWNPDSGEPASTPFDRDNLNHRLTTLKHGSAVG
jgi:Plasmid pRiA4b ORF-3-like protein